MGRLLVVGSVAFDTVRTPFGEATEVLGGSATYFSTAASFFTDVDLIAVVGEDFPDEHVAFLKNRGIDVSGLERRSGKTFRWQGEYTYQLNEAHTLDTQLNVLESFRPKIPDHYRTPDMLFLGNIDPELQMDVLNQVERPRIVACDTMNFWIHGKRKPFGTCWKRSTCSSSMTEKLVNSARTSVWSKSRKTFWHAGPNISLSNGESMAS